MTKIAPDGQIYTWGEIVNIHEVGPYQIVEYFPNYLNLNMSRPNHAMFHVYVDKKDASRGSYTLEGALLIAIGVKNKCVEAARYAAKVLDVTSDYD